MGRVLQFRKFNTATLTQIDRLYYAILHTRKIKSKKSRTAKLLAAGPTKIAKKVVEEAAEVSLDYISGDRQGVIMETADMMYNTMVLLADMDIRPQEVWSEMERREKQYGIAGKIPKKGRNKKKAPTKRSVHKLRCA